MQILMLLLFIALYMHDGLRPEGKVAVNGWALAAIVGGVKVALLLLYAMACHLTRRSLMRPSATGVRPGMRLAHMDRVGTIFRFCLIASFTLDLYAGWLAWLRLHWPGDLVLIDELLALAPTIALLAAGWAAYYPIDRRLREAGLMRRIEEGLPIYPIWSRGQYLLNQARHQLALMGLPLMTLWAWKEAMFMHPLPKGFQYWDMPLQLVGVAIVFLAMPPIMRRVWSTMPLPQGELRARLSGMCAMHGVRVRELLLWKTYGGIINAAVMGIIAPVRYILLTDALLEQMPLVQIEAVMAHEIAHARKHHMFWLLAAAIGVSGAMDCAAVVIEKAMPQNVNEVIQWVLGAALLGAFLLVFGWVSRRFERQADTFAVEHMVMARGPGTAVVDSDSAQVMIDALGQVAALNHIEVEHHNWLHGSIGWRQRYLRGLVGLPLNRLPIHRRVMWINAATAAATAATVAGYIIEAWHR